MSTPANNTPAKTNAEKAHDLLVASAAGPSQQVSPVDGTPVRQAPHYQERYRRVGVAGVLALLDVAGAIRELAEATRSAGK